MKLGAEAGEEVISSIWNMGDCTTRQSTFYAKKNAAGFAWFMADTETNLGAMLRCYMAMERWPMRKLAPKIGISAPTLHRICSGYAMDADTLLKVLNWMVGPKS